MAGLLQRYDILTPLHFENTDSQLGPYISLMGYARGTMLLIVIPREPAQ